MAAVECVLRWCDACMGIMGIMGIMRVMLVRHDIPRGFALPLCGMARVQINRRVCGQRDGCGGMRVAVA